MPRLYNAIMNIVIAGKGVWGNALYSVLSQNVSTVSFSERGKPIAADVVVLALPTQAIRSVLPTITFTSPEKVIINTSKGIERDTHLFPQEIVKDVLGEDVTYAALMGPSFAEEVSAKLPTLVNFGFIRETPVLETVRKMFSTSYFRLQPTKHMQALEIAGAFKNVYAIGCGISEGLGYKINTRSQLLVMALAELQSLFAQMEVSYDTTAMPEAVGDVILTCSSTNSRNYTFGTLLSQYPTAVCLQRIGATVEGYETAASIPFLEDKTNTKLPLAHTIWEILQENDPTKVKEIFGRLLQNN